MSKAEKKNEKKNRKKTASKHNQFGSKKTDWRNVALGDPDEDTTDTEDDDDNQETRRFLNLIKKAKKKNTKVSLATPTRGKRKFGDRMSLNEAKLEDFDDTKDYVNFIQDKLQGVRIKIIK